MDASSAPSSPSSEARPADTRFHILVLDPAFQDAGRAGPTRSYDLVTRLISAGHRVTVLTTSFAVDADTTQETPGLTVITQRIVRTDERDWAFPEDQRGRYWRGIALRLWGIADVDAVIAVAEPWAIVPLAAVYAWIRAVPLLLDVRRLPPPPLPETATRGERFAAWAARLGRRIALTLPRRVISASPAITTALTEAGVADARCLKIPFGSDTRLMTVPPGRDNGVLLRNPDFAGKPLIVYAGRFTADRALDALVVLAAAVKDEIPEARIILCGDGPARADLVAQAEALGAYGGVLRIITPLPRRELADLLSAAAVVAVVPGRDDTAGGFFDALAAGRPVFALYAGWQRTLLESRGAGFGLPLYDPRAAARELADILRDQDGLRRAGQQAAALAASRFNLDRTIAELRVALETIIIETPRHEILRRRTLTAKRAVDIVGAALGLIVLSPVLLVLAIMVAVKLGRPIMFPQMRSGLKGRAFRMYKFRTLTDAEESDGALLPEQDRLTPFGKFLRRTALDELPELVNVLLGDMSLVGPRPLPPEYLPFYTPSQRRRSEMRPGMTGWAQIHRLEAPTWEEKFARDVEYVERVSIGLDFKIIAKTVAMIFAGRNVAGDSAMPRFDAIMARREGAEDV